MTVSYYRANVRLQVMIGEDKVLRFGGCKSGEACTIVLRGASSHVLDEAERSLHDALCVLVSTVKEPRTICGGGCTEVLMAQVSMIEALVFEQLSLYVQFLKSCASCFA